MSSEQIQKLLKDWRLWPGVCLEQPTLDNFSGLVKGLTNNNLLFTYKKNSIISKYVYRINAQNAKSLYLNRTAEWHIHQSISQFNICEPYIYRCPKNSYWVRRYIEGITVHETITASPQGLTDNLLKEVAVILKLTHNIPISNSWPKINFKQRTDHYWQQILKRLNNNQLEIASNLNNLKIELDIKLKSSGYSPRLCHMDPNPNNWIIGENKIHLIDWEYSAIGNPAWDLAIICDTFELTENQKEKFLRHYSSSLVKQKQLDFAQLQMEYLSALWFCVQSITNTKNLVDGLLQITKKIDI
jgi:thiamine kinase-like enzyme